MATSVIEICNNALTDLGEEAIASLGDNTKAARLCNQRWPAVRDAVLRAHPWNCALAQAELAASATSPAWRHAAAYPLPADCLRVLEACVGGSPLDEWEAQAGAVHCDAQGPLQLLYIRRVDDPRLYDPLLCETLTARLAATLAYPLTASTSLAQSFWGQYADKLREARGVDAREAAPPMAPAPTTWLAAKLGR
ncbi:hypothetical protein SAMN04488503_2867 [Humidesulfovibrio mexicanus]|uniref:Uncharacterized protein n=1 Tax=Humidesulfovibrio mexicanus TaxID=147047 RepID=A0A239BXH1_9BACT|nr:hypothetical protein [Humidesulfovibrio mexicanus]SNS12755.1 hypothetical protein SAMN04488503_2867 [Humidesulfovibrio mexicanus]